MWAERDNKNTSIVRTQINVINPLLCEQTEDTVV